MLRPICASISHRWAPEGQQGFPLPGISLMNGHVGVWLDCD